MHKIVRFIVSRIIIAGLCGSLAASQTPAQTAVRSVKVMGNKGAVEVEVEASDRLVPQTQVLTGPDRLVIDFLNAVPASGVRNQSIDRGDVKDVRIGLFQSNPPVTRLVLDLKTAQSYQVFPNGRTVMIKVLGGMVASKTAPGPASVDPPASHPTLVTANYTTHIEPVQVEAPAQPSVQVSYRDGLLGIRANRATLAEVLYAVQQRTGADIAIAAGAEQERVVANIEPAPAAEVLARLLNGSRFNFLILNAADDPNHLDRVILSTRPDGGFVPTPPPQDNDDNAADEQPAVVRNEPNDAARAPVRNQANAEPENKPSSGEEAADNN